MEDRVDTRLWVDLGAFSRLITPPPDALLARQIVAGDITAILKGPLTGDGTVRSTATATGTARGCRFQGLPHPFDVEFEGQISATDIELKLDRMRMQPRARNQIAGTIDLDGRFDPVSLDHTADLRMREANADLLEWMAPHWVLWLLSDSTRADVTIHTQSRQRGRFISIRSQVEAVHAAQSRRGDRQGHRGP